MQTLTLSRGNPSPDLTLCSQALTLCGGDGGSAQALGAEWLEITASAETKAMHALCKTRGQVLGHTGLQVRYLCCGHPQPCDRCPAQSTAPLHQRSPNDLAHLTPWHDGVRCKHAHNQLRSVSSSSLTGFDSWGAETHLRKINSIKTLLSLHLSSPSTALGPRFSVQMGLPACVGKADLSRGVSAAFPSLAAPGLLPPRSHSGVEWGGGGGLKYLNKTWKKKLL